MIMDRLYGGVCYAGIDTDPELKYPKVGQAEGQVVALNKYASYEQILNSLGLRWTYLYYIL